MNPVVAVHAAATLFLAGLIWFVQVVHYPLFLHVGRQGFTDYERRHAERTTLVVGPAMLTELVTAVWLVVHPPAGVPAALPRAGLALLAVIWISTAFLQVPRHRRLARRFDEADVRALVATNWIRTLAWTARAAVALLLIPG